MYSIVNVNVHFVPFRTRILLHVLHVFNTRYLANIYILVCTTPTRVYCVYATLHPYSSVTLQVLLDNWCGLRHIDTHSNHVSICVVCVVIVP